MACRAHQWCNTVGDDVNIIGPVPWSWVTALLWVYAGSLRKTSVFEVTL